jgi:hypothetical protein
VSIAIAGLMFSFSIALPHSHESNTFTSGDA